MVKAISNPCTLDIAPFSSALRATMLGHLSNEALYEGMHIVAADGSVASGGFAFVELLAHLLPRCLQCVRRGIRLKPVAATLMRLYRFLGSHRGQLARFVPNVAPVERVTRNDL